MKAFGLQKDEIDLIKNKIEKIFGVDTDVKVFLFGSRAIGKHRKLSDIDLAFKSKNKDLDDKLIELRFELEDSSIPLKVDLVNWDKIIKEYLPNIKRQKVPFWDKDEIDRKTPWRICPLGQHWVSEHLKSGNSDSTDGHCAKNPSRKDLIKTAEIKLISQSEIFKNVPLKASQKAMGFKELENRYDVDINGWCAYWNDILQPKNPIHPNVIKALIATESSFNENPARSKKHTAIGITQIMPKTIRLLKPTGNELKDHFIDVKEKDAFDPSINICLSIRWIFRKYEIVSKRKKTEVDWLDVIDSYKGIGKQKGIKSDGIRSKVREYYNKLEQ